MTVDTSPGPNVIISWPRPAYGECPCVTYALRINGVDQTNDIPCGQTSVEIESGKLLNCALNNVSVIPRSAHPSIGLLENLGDDVGFMYGPISKLIPVNTVPCTTVSHMQGLSCWNRWREGSLQLANVEKDRHLCIDFHQIN